MVMSPDHAEHKGAGVDGPPLADEGDISMVGLGGEGQYLIEACPAPLKQHHRAPPTNRIDYKGKGPKLPRVSEDLVSRAQSPTRYSSRANKG